MKKTSYILLILGIVLAVILNFLPHINYSYPLHVDEWVHFQFSNYLSSGVPLYFGQTYTSLEAGFHYLLATLNSMGVSYEFVFQFFASIITILICLGAFILTRKIWNETAGLFAVLFIALLQSSVTYLGPAFLVPMALGLFFLLIGLYLIEIKSNLWFIVFAFLLIMHPPTALAFFVLININFLIKRQNYWKNILLQVISGLIALPLYFGIFMNNGLDTADKLTFAQIIPALFIPRYLGWAILLLVLIGIYVSIKDKKYLISIYSIALLLFIVMFYQLKIEVFIPYARALMYLFIIFAIAFGIGCESVLSIFKSNRIRILLGIILVAIILIVVLPAKFESNKYIYHIVDEKDIFAFNWIKDNSPENSIVVLDPWKANAFTPIAERQVYSRIVQGPNNISEIKNKEVYNFFKANCTDMNFLEQNNISIVYGDCSGSNLKEAYPNVYLR